MNTKKDINQMTPREIAYDALLILHQYGYTKAKEMTKEHVQVINKKLSDITKKLNKALGTHRSPVKIRVLSDFHRFR